MKVVLTDLSKGNINEYSYEIRIKTKSEKYIWILSRGKAVTSESKSEPERIIGTHVDINRMKTIEESLKNHELELKKQNENYIIVNQNLEESNQKIKKINRNLKDKQAHLDSIFKSVPASIGLISDKIILFANNYTCLMTGYNMDELIGRDTSLLYSSLDEFNRVYEVLCTNNTGGNAKSINTVWRMKNGILIDVYITATKIEIDSSAMGFTFSALDITSQRLYEDELIKARDHAEKAEKLKTTFLANMSHELRTPMNGIVGFAELLQNQMNNVKRDQYLKIIVNSSKQLLRIVTDIVDISKIETGEVDIFLTGISISGLMKEFHDICVDQLQVRHKPSINVTYNCKVPSKHDSVLMDENKLRQIFSNIINNAVKFTENGSIDFGVELKDDFLHFYFADTGIGIDPQEQEVIFECFRQTESPSRRIYGGTGLGLAIAKGLIEAMGGKIWVNSEKGKGSVFYCTLPYYPDENQIKEEMEEESLEKNWQDYHILVVEDDLACLTLINELLEETHVKISNAFTGLEAVKACRKDATIDVVLMDMRLPELDGYEATKRIKEFRPEIKIIAQTAHALSDDKKKCLLAGCDDYMTKPIVQAILYNKIEAYLGK
jgi:PAS domain S-box-containing protein